MKTINLTRFDGGYDNPTSRIYEKEFKELLAAVFGVKGYFTDLFSGGLEAVDGVRESENAFYVKTSNIPVSIQEYDTDLKAFGEQTDTSNRFGPRTEVIYTDIPVPYTWTWAIHEGIDRHTVNNDFDTAIADRLDLQAQAKVAQFNKHHGEFISSYATIIEVASQITKENVGDVFNKINKALVNAGAVGTKIAKVTPDVYAAIVDSGLSTTAKNSAVDIKEGTVVKFKGFEVEEIPEDLFGTNEVIYAYIAEIAKAFTGINTVRTIESEAFDGVALQGSGKAGEYIPEANRKAVYKVTVTGA